MYNLSRGKTRRRYQRGEWDHEPSEKPPLRRLSKKTRIIIRRTIFSIHTMVLCHFENILQYIKIDE